MAIVLLRYVDLETSDKVAESDVLEIGLSNIWFDTEAKTCAIEPPLAATFKPTKPLAPENIAIHHLTDAMLADRPICTPEDLIAAATEKAPAFLVAHNSAFEQLFFIPEFCGEARWICTLKAARRAWEEAPGHDLQTLRYWRGLDLDPALAMPPHRAGPDTHVGAHVLAELLKTETVNDLVRWTRQPLYYPTCPLGKHRGQKWTEIPHSYLKWMTSNANDLDHDIKFAALTEINRRQDEGARR